MKARKQDVPCHISDLNVSECEGRYANNFKVGHNACEFVMDFGQLFSGRFEERFHSRIVTNPVSAKYFFEVLQRSITEYEKKFAVIPLEGQGKEAGTE